MSDKSSELSMLEAINETLHSEMARDERIVILGEDVGRNGGVFRATEGLSEKFGEIILMLTFSSYLYLFSLNLYVPKK